MSKLEKGRLVYNEDGVKIYFLKAKVDTESFIKEYNERFPNGYIRHLKSFKNESRGTSKKAKRPHLEDK